ncbi:hypothetical protein HWV62_32535 [Athelia sp. TMB]|nr:hypothetical protein HWV62_32535 [Athelia sp. TMB]
MNAVITWNLMLIPRAGERWVLIPPRQWTSRATTPAETGQARARTLRYELLRGLAVAVCGERARGRGEWDADEAGGRIGRAFLARIDDDPRLKTVLVTVLHSAATRHQHALVSESRGIISASTSQASWPSLSPLSRTDTQLRRNALAPYHIRMPHMPQLRRSLAHLAPTACPTPMNPGDCFSSGVGRDTDIYNRGATSEAAGDPEVARSIEQPLQHAEERRCLLRCRAASLVTSSLEV